MARHYCNENLVDVNIKKCLLLTESSKSFFKLLEEHHNLSCDIKWLSLAHDFGKDNKFQYNIDPYQWKDEYVIYIVFEDSSHLIDLDNPNNRVKGRLYGFVLHRNGGIDYLKPFRWWDLVGCYRTYTWIPDSYQLGKYGCLNDISTAEIKLDYSLFISNESEDMFSIESIEKKKNNLHAIRKNIDGIIFPFLIEYFPRVLIPIIIDYSL